MSLIVGIRAGLVAGIKAGINGDASQDLRDMIVIAGQSNGVGNGTAAFITNGYQLAEPFPAVRTTRKVSYALTDPITWVEFATDSTQPRTGAGTPPDFGVELSMARRLEDAAPGRFGIGMFGMSGARLDSNFLDSSGFPSLPGGGPTMFDQLVTFIQSLPGPIKAFVWMQGETDAGSATPAANYGANLTTFFSDLRTALGLPTLPIIFTRLNNSVVATFKADVRTGQATVDALANNTMVDTDDLTPLADSFHFTPNQYVTLGSRLADSVLSVLSVEDPPVVDWTQVPSGLGVTFTDASTDDGTITSRLWNFGDGATSTATSPSRTYAADGTYTVTMTATDNLGAVTARSRIVNVTSTAVAVDGPGSVYVPVTSAQWTALGLTAPTTLYPCQEAAGALVDANAVRNLTVVGTGHLYSQVVAGWTRTFVGFGLSAAGRFADATGPDPATNSIAFLMYLQLVSSPALSRQVAQIASPTVFTLQVTSTATGQYRLSNGTTKDGGAGPAGLVMPVLILHNRAQSMARIYTGQERIAGTYNGSVAGRFLAIGNGGTSTAAMRVGLAAEWSGAAAETAFPSDAAVRTFLQKLNWRPNW